MDKPIPRSYGARGDRIAVDLPNGKSVNAIAGNEVNTNDIFVLTAGEEYYVFSNTPPNESYSTRTVRRLIPEEIPEEIPPLLPFQALFTPPVNLGGDRPPVTLSNFASVNIGGINNLGNQEYFIVWLQDQIVTDNNQLQTFLEAPEIFQMVEPIWIGNGILKVEFLKDFPEENLVKQVLSSDDLIGLELPELDEFDLNLPEDPFIASDLPPDFSAPLYTKFDERLRYDIRSGAILTTQEEEEYKLTKLESFTYQNEVSPDSTQLPVAAITDINILCNFGNSGLVATTKYQRNTETDYTLSERETFNTTFQNWLNDQLNSGDRDYDRKKYVRYTVSPTLFTNEIDFRCENLTPGVPPVFAFYDWEPVTNFSFAIYSGESHVYSENETIEINEEWIKNIGPLLSRVQKQILSETFTRSETYTVSSNTWQVTVFNFSFQFESDGVVVISQTRNTQDEIITPSSKLISGDGNAVLFTETESTLDQNIIVNRTRSIDKLSALNINGDVTEISFVTTTEVEQTLDDNFYLAIADVLTQIETEESWMFSVVYGEELPELGVGTFTFSNSDSSPIFTSSLNKITAYNKTETTFDFINFPNQIVPEEIGIVFTDVEQTEFAYWSNITGISVYIYAQNFRYTGTVLSFAFEDNPDEELSIDIKRSVTSIQISITAIEAYPIGLAEENEVLISPIFNMSVLVRDRILSDSNKVHANLVNETLYFSKSIIFDPSLEEQFAQVFLLGQVITEEAIEAGAFIPLAGAENIISTSYFPVE